MKNKKDQEKMYGEKMIDAIIEYLAKNKEEFANALEIPNLQGEEKEENIILFRKKPLWFQNMVTGVVLIVASLPYDLIERYFYSDEEYEEVLYEE